MAVESDIVYSDLDHRLIKDGLGNLKLSTNIAAIMSSIDNILRTSKGSRVMLPSFASKLRSMLFGSMDATLMKFISREVKEVIEAWDPRVQVVEVSVAADPDASTFSLSVNFIVKGQGNIFQYQTSIKGN